MQPSGRTHALRSWFRSVSVGRVGLLDLDQTGSRTAGSRVFTGENVGVPVTYVLVVRLPADGVASFQRYESAVLPILSEHDGTLERRLQGHDQQTEVHVVSPSLSI